MRRQRIARAARRLRVLARPRYVSSSAAAALVELQVGAVPDVVPVGIVEERRVEAGGLVVRGVAVDEAVRDDLVDDVLRGQRSEGAARRCGVRTVEVHAPAGETERQEREEDDCPQDPRGGGGDC